MREGKTYSFSSSLPGTRGRKEVIKKYEQWYYDEGTGEKTVLCVSKEFLQDVKARRGETDIYGSTLSLNAVRRKYVK